MPVLALIVIGLVGEAAVGGGLIFAGSKVLDRQRKAALQEVSELVETEKAKLGEQAACFFEGVAEAAEKAFG